MRETINVCMLARCGAMARCGAERRVRVRMHVGAVQCSALRRGALRTREC